MFLDQLTASLQSTSMKFFSTSSEHQKEQILEHSATTLFAILWAFHLKGDNAHNYKMKRTNKSELFKFNSS